MQDLIKQEQFELEVLDSLNSKRLLSNIVFTGGTMLRLCHGLNRFSVDLDFWIIKKINEKRLFKDIEICLAERYEITDSANKFHTLLYEIRSKEYPRRLKIEIRKQVKAVNIEQAIAYSKNSNIQVILNVVSLAKMMEAKVEAFLNRKEIRDVFDIEFLVKKGVILESNQNDLKILLNGINSFTKRDYTIKLNSLLEKGQRDYYREENFKILKSIIQQKLAG